MEKEHGQNLPARLKRSESFLGIHFDFHAGDDCDSIGAKTTPEMIEAILDEVKPDYVQCDCKGHVGFCSYPSKVGNPAPGIKKDALRIWRDVTASRGVSLYMHYSGVLDGQAVKHHPSWARIDEKGKRAPQATSTFGPYADRLMIPQLKELSDIYGVDGAWVDGDCWGTEVDYGKKVAALFTQQTGHTAPSKPGDPNYEEYVEFCREAFRRYVRHVADEMHRHNPNFQIASNWSFTSFMPEPVSANVDFISGDYSPQNSFQTARFEGRCMRDQGKPWDLMAWAFSFKPGDSAFSTKTAAQLKQEAAAVLSLGGGFQAYFTQKRDGSVRVWQMKTMGEVARFCRARQKVCHRAKAVPQVALLYSGTEYYHKNPRPFGPADDFKVPMRGTMQALLDSQYSVEIKMEHQIRGKMADYPLIVNPEWTEFDPAIRAELLDYAKNGGSLLMIGAKATEGFAKELGIELNGDVREDVPVWIEQGGRLGGLNTAWRSVKPLPGTETFGRLCFDNDVVGPTEIAATVAKYGKGRIAGVYFDFGERYLHGATAASRDFLAALVAKLFPEPAVSVGGSHFVDVAVNTVGGKLAVNLVNTAGPHTDLNIFSFDEIPPVGPLTVTIRCAKKPQSVTRMPEGDRMDFAYDNGKITLTLPRLDIHEILLVE